MQCKACGNTIPGEKVADKNYSLRDLLCNLCIAELYENEQRAGMTRDRGTLAAYL